MSQQVTITSVTANTPVEIYYCNSMSASCVYVSTVSVFPYTFDVPPPYDEENIVIKIVDTQSCEDGYVIPITPTPTPTITATQTPTQTPTTTPQYCVSGMTNSNNISEWIDCCGFTQSGSTSGVTICLNPSLPYMGITVSTDPCNISCTTPTPTASVTPTQTETPTNTPTPTTTLVIASHSIGNKLSVSSATTCTNTITLTNYYTYIANAYLTPMISAVVYQTESNGVLYNPFNGGGRYLKMGFGGGFYVVKIDTQGAITAFQICP